MSDPLLMDVDTGATGYELPVLAAPSQQVVDSVAGARLLAEPRATESPVAVFVRAIRESEKSFFNITFADCDGVERTFAFSLMPAIESNLRFQSSSRLSAGTGATVPEVKPGLLRRTVMNVKRFSVPGGPPAVQVLGTEQTLWQLVGAFIGAETLQRGRSGAQKLYPRWPSDEDPKHLNAEFYARYFDEHIVQVGRSVEVHVYSVSKGGSDVHDVDMEIRFRAVLQSVRYFVVRQDRVYYAFDLLVTEYKQCGR